MFFIDDDLMNTFGKKLPEDVTTRAVIPMGVLPCTAQVTLYPGQEVHTAGYPATSGLGIVDPFLKNPVFPGERFWMFMNPKTSIEIKSTWSHQSVPENVSESQQLLKKEDTWELAEEPTKEI